MVQTCRVSYKIVTTVTTVGIRVRRKRVNTVEFTRLLSRHLQVIYKHHQWMASLGNGGGEENGMGGEERGRGGEERRMGVERRREGRKERGREGWRGEVRRGMER